MTKATLVPGKPAVTETKVVEVSPATPDKVVLELSREEALALYKATNISLADSCSLKGFDCSREYRLLHRTFNALYDLGFRREMQSA